MTGDLMLSVLWFVWIAVFVGYLRGCDRYETGWLNGR